MRSKGPTRTSRALPRRFRRARLLIMGCGDVGLRLSALLAGRVTVVASSRRPEQRARIRALGATPVDPTPGRRLAALARWQVYLIPPPRDGDDDPLLARHLAARLGRPPAGPPSLSLGHPGGGRSVQSLSRPDPRPSARIVYASTTGVFGDARGARLTETSPAQPDSDRAIRRLAAERALRAACLPRSGPGTALRASILRVPGIYAHDRLPLERLRRGLPCLTEADDGYSNHIHADDLARALWLSLMRAPTARLYIASDGHDMKMGDYFTRVARATGLPVPPRLPAAEVRRQVSPMMWSFMRESRRLDNKRLLRELRLRLQYPSIDHTLAGLPEPDAAAAS
ncbi:MAG: SDR family NAD(P)-dependent oxidoreductase [Burkholderiaceae bacterium]